MKKTNSTQELIGIKRFSSNGVKTDKSEIAFFSVKPTNISVLSKTSIEIKITKLMQLLSANPDIEIICSDARENFTENKHFLTERLSNEENKNIRLLLKSDRRFLDEIQIQMATAREFMFAYRIRNESKEQAIISINRIDKQINEQGFEARRMCKRDVKRILAEYFGTNISDIEPDDYDGESAVHKWVINY